MLEEYEQLRNVEKEEFAHVVNTLMLKSFILRDYYDRNAKMMRASKEYSFIERHLDLVSNYLSLSGWIVNKDSSRGVISIKNEYEENHLKLDLKTSLVIFALRYVYETQNNDDALNQVVRFTSHELMQCLINMHLIRQDKRVSYSSLESSYRFLEQHNIITRISGDFYEKNLTFYINPSIAFVVDYEVIQSLYKQVESLPDEEFMEDAE